MDKLPTANDIVTKFGKDLKISSCLKDIIGEKGDKENYRHDIATVLTHRVINHALIKGETFTDEMIENFLNFVSSVYFTNDLKPVFAIKATKHLKAGTFRRAIFKDKQLNKYLVED